MFVTITSITLKSPFHFFALSASALNILRQLKTTNCVAFKKRGFWTTHYTMTLWQNQEDMKAFARSGAHLAAMKTSNTIAKEIKTTTIEAEALPTWAEAKKLLETGKVFVY